ncbi:uncharacterized protein [Eurosta solidaginis]|uniref:uncharacterized protein n=1 Tax=Eurosta solidaginis TaxID=178769 RepID=UPI0035312736
MPCFCGHRVERAQSSVQCEKCKKVYHLQCVVGTLAADLDHFKNSDEMYICGDCAVDDNAIAVQKQQQQHVNDNYLNFMLSSILAEVKSLRAQQASAVAGIHSLQADKNRLLGELEILRSELSNLHKLYDEAVGGVLRGSAGKKKETKQRQRHNLG